MPKKKTPSIKEAREWLELYESGWSEAHLAQQKGRDIRTIHKYLAETQAERRFNQAELEVLKTALTKHQEQLLATLNKLYAAIALPEPDTRFYFRKDASKIEFNAGKVVDTQLQPLTGIVAKLGLENTLLFTLIEQHLEHDPAFSQLNAWYKARENYIRMCQSFCIELVEGIDRIGREVGIELCAELGGENDILLDFIYKNSFKFILSNDSKFLEKAIERLSIDKNRGEIILKPGTTLLSCPGYEEVCFEGITKLLSIDNLKRFTNIRVACKQLEIETQTLKRTIQTLILANFVQGECDVCRRLRGQRSGK